MQYGLHMKVQSPPDRLRTSALLIGAAVMALLSCGSDDTTEPTSTTASIDGHSDTTEGSTVPPTETRSSTAPTSVTEVLPPTLAPTSVTEVPSSTRAPTTEPEPEPEPTTSMTSPQTTTDSAVGSIPQTLVGEYHQVRRIETSTEELRVLILYPDASYELFIQPQGYHESGVVLADAETIQFAARGSVDREWTFSGRDVARWSLGASELGIGVDLVLSFPDGRGYGYDGYDKGADIYFPCEQANSCVQ